MNIESKNFTNFQNVNLKGTPGVTSGSYNGGVLRFSAGGASYGLQSSGTWDSTVAVVPISGSTSGSANGSVEAPYFSIANAGLNIGTGYIRFVPFGSTGGFASTISVNSTYNDAERAWTLPSKSGTFPISGTFSVDVPIINASSYAADTIVTVTGIRAEDGVTLTPLNNGASGAIMSARGAAIPINVVPGNGNITITFGNPFATATIFRTAIYGYTAVR